MAKHLITTRAVGTLCPKCRQPILTGLAEGVPAHVDLTALDPAGEVNALLADRWTYTLTRGGELVHRDAIRIRGGHLRGPVLPDHHCGGRP